MSRYARQMEEAIAALWSFFFWATIGPLYVCFALFHHLLDVLAEWLES